MKALVSRMPLDPGLHLYKWWRHTLALSGVLLVASALLLGLRGLNFGVDFRGGVQMEVQALSGAVDLDALRAQVAEVVDGAVVQSFGGDEEALINLPLSVAPAPQVLGEEAEGADALGAPPEVRQLKELLGEEYEFRRTEFVGPKVGGELRRAGDYRDSVFAVGDCALCVVSL